MVVIKQKVGVAILLPQLLQGGGEGIYIVTVARLPVQFFETAEHNGDEPYIAIAQEVSICLVTEEVVETGFGYLQGFIQIMRFARQPVQQDGRLKHLSAVVGILLAGNVPFHRDIVPIEVVCRVLKMAPGPIVKGFAGIEITAVVGC